MSNITAGVGRGQLLHLDEHIAKKKAIYETCLLYTSRMYRVVQNVIENAVKYSLKGTRIFLRITEADQNIKLEVINTASYEMNFTEEEIMERFALSLIHILQKSL